MTALIQYFHMFLKGSFQKEIRNDLNCHLSLASQLKSYWQGWNHQSFHCCRTKNICIVFEKNSLFFNFSVIQSSNYEILRICVWSWHTYIICASAYFYLLTFFVCKEQGCVNMKHKCSDSCWRCYCAVQPAYMCHAVWKQNNCILQNHSYLVRHCKTVCSREKKVQGVVF